MKTFFYSKHSGSIDRCGDEALNRREFLKRQLLGACFFAAGAAGLYLPKRLFASPVPDIGIAKGKPGSATRAAMDLIGGMRTFVKPGAKVVIKPNLSFPQGPEAATTTHPLVTREIVAMCLEAGASRIRVLDHPAGDFVQAETSINRTREALKVFEKDMVFGLTKKAFYKATHNVGFKPIVHSQIRFVPVTNHAQTFKIITLLLDLLFGIVTASLAKFSGIDLDPDLADFLFYLQFNR